ncbi:hypothetical protein GCM10010195_28950 [Kitasatospora griseola]|nr:hypothetical protein GCM10010195_28950 [Kitasatospora griseola]
MWARTVLCMRQYLSFCPPVYAEGRAVGSGIYRFAVGSLSPIPRSDLIVQV